MFYNPLNENNVCQEKSVRTLSYAPGPLDNAMQKHVRETMGDPEQAKLYTDMATQVSCFICQDRFTFTDNKQLLL